MAGAQLIVPRAGDLRRRVRSAKPRRSVKELLSVVVERALYLVVLGGLMSGVVRAGLGRITGGGPPLETLETSVIQLTGAVIALLCLVLSAKALLAVGPLYVDGPARTWMLSTPVDRGRLLLRHLAVTVTIGMVTSVAVGIAFAAVTRLAVPLLPWLTLWVALGVILACACVLVQAKSPSTRSVQRGLDVVAYALVAAAVTILIVRPGHRLSALEQAGTPAWTSCVIALSAAAACTLFMARRSLDTMTAGAVSAGVELATAIRASLLSLDTTLFSDVVVERRARTAGRVRPAPISGNRGVALVRTDGTRVLRRRTGLFVWAALMAVPYGASVAGLTGFLPALHMVVAFVAVDRLAGGLRFVARSPALRHALGGTDRTLMLAHLVIPTAGAVLWAAVTALLIPGLSALTAAVSAVGAVLVTYRVATRPPLDYGSALIDFGLFGPMPVTLIVQLLRGPALLAGLALLQITLAG